VPYLFFLELWDLEEEEKKMHATPMRKAIKGVVQGAVRYVEFTGSYAAGELTVGVMPSLRGRRGKSPKMVKQGAKTCPMRSSVS
jgi:hypothetical protein